MSKNREMLMKPNEAWRILTEIMKDKKHKEAFKRLQQKCKYEKMTLTGVISEWGDPREWGFKNV